MSDQETTVRYWYDRSWRSWGVAKYVGEDQEGEATWVYTRKEAVREAQLLCELLWASEQVCGDVAVERRNGVTVLRAVQ